MKLDRSLYVPVLKVKRGEKKALRHLRTETKRHITPLLEIIERRPKGKQQIIPTLEVHVANAFVNLKESLSEITRCFLDVRELAADGPDAAKCVFDLAVHHGIAFTPVTGLSRSADVLAALKFKTNGTALRVTRAELERGSLKQELLSFMKKHNLAYAEIDLILDLGSVEDMVADGVSALTEVFLDEIPEQNQWRTMTISGSAFPLGMARVEKNGHALAERSEWKAWLNDLFPKRYNLPRLPIFSDTCIQHPRGVEGFNFRTMKASATIRYTLNDEWLLIKGESTKIKSAKEQFPNIATRLVYGNLKPQYLGSAHCRGCYAIRASAEGLKEDNTPEAWRTIGTVHHIETVTHRIADLLYS